jgi:hypothetical protein
MHNLAFLETQIQWCSSWSCTNVDPHDPTIGRRVGRSARDRAAATACALTKFCSKRASEAAESAVRGHVGVNRASYQNTLHRRYK